MFPKIIDCFDNEYSFLSNFYECPVEYDGIVYQSSEAAFQAQKTLNIEERIVLFTSATPSQSKKLGRKIKLRDDWDSIKVRLMKEIVLAKFTQNNTLKEKLLKTGTAELIEGNWWKDTFWGVCNGKGLNHLGRILMEVRDELN